MVSGRNRAIMMSMLNIIDAIWQQGLKWQTQKGFTTLGCIPCKLYAKGVPGDKCFPSLNAEKSLVQEENFGPKYIY